MPGPPPPSKSYLLKFDSSSEEEEDDYYSRPPPDYSQPPPAPMPIPPSGSDTSRQGPLKQNRQDTEQSIPNPNDDLFQMLKSLDGGASNLEGPNTNVNTQTTTLNNESEPSPDVDAENTTKKKKKKKRKKKKKKTNSSGATGTPASTCKKVSFSRIHVAEFQRNLNGDGVPYDGGWPLALSNKLHREFSIDIEDFETRKQTELRDRYQKYVTERRKKKHESGSSSSSSRRKRSHSKNSEELNKKETRKPAPTQHLPVYTPENYLWETRQFDYRGRSTDKHREDGKDPKLEWDEINSTGKNSLFRQLGESERKHLFERDVSPSPSSDEMFCSLEIKHIRNELEQIRIHRSAEDAAGCSCRKLHVVLPSGLNGGKKSHKSHRRLTERRVKDELRRRHVSFESRAKREELEQLLHDTVDQQGCCYGNDCPCSRSGIGCQSDTCSCWHMSHTTHKKDHGEQENASPADAKVRCGNRNGIYVVDFDRIAKHRDLFCKARASGICGEVS